MTEKEGNKIQEINIWELGGRISIRINFEFLHKLKISLFDKFGTKRKAFQKLNLKISFKTFSGILKEGYNKKYFIPLDIWISLCSLLNINLIELQKNIVAYKTSNGRNFISNPILPIKITPIFDMIIAHNIGDGTVINPKNGRLPYFGYRQFNLFFRELYIKKLESIFGRLNFPEKYYLKTTRSYCPPVLASLFFQVYNLNVRSFLSKSARLPKIIFEKHKDFLLAILIGFIIDEGNIDSTAIVILLRNKNLIYDLSIICKKLGYDFTISEQGDDYSCLFILRKGMFAFFRDYKEILKKYPEMSLGKIESKIEKSFQIYNRPIYKTKGNQDLILNLLKTEDLSVNQIAEKINMTRQGVRFHINNLEMKNLIFKNGFIGERNIVYSYRGR